MQPVLADGAKTAGVSVGELQVGFDPKSSGLLKRGAWMPVWTTVTAGDGAVRAMLRLSAPDDLAMSNTVKVPIDLAAHESKRVVGYVRAGVPKASIEAFLDDGSASVARLTRRTAQPSLQIGPETKLVLHAGPVPGLEKVGALPKFGGADPKERLVVFSPLSAWPDKALGLDAASVVVVNGNDDAALAALRAGGIEVLRAWVARGGHLVVTLGDRFSQTASVLGDLLPARLEGTSLVSDVGAIETFAGSVSPPLRATVSAVRMTPDARRPHVVLAATPATPLMVRAAYGLGRITVSGIDLPGKPLADWANVPLLWDKLLDIPGRLRDLSGVIPESRGALIQSSTAELSGQIHQSLEAFPGVQLIPFGWVALLIFGYLLLIGPIDYFFLRKVVRRMELTWLTFPVIVCATTIGAFAAAYALKGHSARLNKLDLLDVDQSSGQVRGASWWTLYSAANRDYDMELESKPGDAGAARPWTPGADRTCTWFAPDDGALIGLGRVAPATSVSVYEPAGDVRELTKVRVPIWSTRSFTGRWWKLEPGIQLVEADLRRIAGDRASGSVRNLLDRPLRNVQLYYGRNVYELGTIRPRGIGRVDFSKAEAIARSLGRLVQNVERRQARIGGPQGETPSKPRADLLRAVLFHDAMGNRADDYPSHALSDLDMTGQLVELKRPMLVAEMDAPAAELSVRGGQAPAAAQTTLVRIVLEMTPDEDSPTTPRSGAARTR